MSRTHPTTLIALGLLGAVAGYLLDLAVASAGHAVFVPPISLPLTLIAIAIIVVLLALPIRRAVRGTSTTRIDPFRALRIAVLAKSCALAGAVLLGGGIGILVYLLSRSTLPALGSIWLAIAAAVGALILLVAGLVAEYFCMLPPRDEEKEAEEARA